MGRKMKASGKCLVLSGNVSIGYQAASLLENHGWQTHVVHSDHEAYDCINADHIDAVVADIDAVDLGGLAVLAFCHRRYPAITTYAIAQTENEYGKRMARDAGGCDGYFYLIKGTLQIDPRHGMAAELTDAHPQDANYS
ncbi:MAG: DNA-binding response regulator [Candidatus Promineifilaceae bacterium]